MNYRTIQKESIEKLMQLHEEMNILYKRILKENDEKMGRLERLIGRG
jgi:hypothetical protein